MFRHSTVGYVSDELYKEYLLDDCVERPTKHVGALLLDSSLITATQNEFTHKIIECGDYLQVYSYSDVKTSRKIKKDNIDNDYLFKNKNSNNKQSLQKIEYKNIMRSKFNMQRLVKSNESSFKTFITLTFSENVNDIETANKKFAIWRTKIKSIFKDFRYVCVPEFQKRGAVHYHLLTNIEIEKKYQYKRRNKLTETSIIIPQKDFNKKQLEEMNLEKRKKCYDVKYWPYGFTSVIPMKNINIIGYMTKYMTKDIDNRLWGRRRYLYSSNLKTPKIFYLNDNKVLDFIRMYGTIEKEYERQYENIYYDVYDNKIQFIEYKKLILNG